MALTAAPLAFLPHLPACLPPPPSQVPEVAFTGDTSGELFEKDGNADVYRAKLLIVECTFVDESVTWEQVGCEPLQIHTYTSGLLGINGRRLLKDRCRVCGVGGWVWAGHVTRAAQAAAGWCVCVVLCMKPGSRMSIRHVK